MCKFNWLSQHRFQSFIRREHDWVFEFDSDCNLVVFCLWRLIKDDQITMTSEDDGHQFGLPAPVDAAARVMEYLENRGITEAILREGTLDLCIHFDNGFILEVLSDSCGYEAWNLQQRPGQEWIAQGGGNLVEYKTG